MSTRCKIYPLVRWQRTMRANALRVRPKTALGAAVMVELALIHASPRLHGSTKHKLFLRGIPQLEGQI